MNLDKSELEKSSEFFSADSTRITVLLVDDQRTIGKILAHMLESEKDIDFHHTQSAREALKIADVLSPTVILQDLIMPEIDGLHMIRYFRAKKKTCRTPLIMLSADENPKVKAEAFALGANDYMVKPPAKIELIARIRYHSQAYINMLQRDDAYKRMEEQSLELIRANEQLREEIDKRKQIEQELRESKKKAEKEREAAESANEKIMESLHYAKTIQRSLLPSPKSIASYLPNSFFIWMPRDIVGGDIFFADFFSPSSQIGKNTLSSYSHSSSENMIRKGFIIAVIDCTGHGVPGAFMTMIASSALRRIIRDEGCHDPAQILKQLNFTIKTTLQQDTDHSFSDDGLDAAIVSVQYSIKDEQMKDTPSTTLTFAGAKLPLFYFQNNKIDVIKGDRQSIGYKRSELDFTFTNHTISVEKGMAFYMTTDGFIDQLGEQEDRKFGNKRFKNLLEENGHLPFKKQKEILIKAFNEYKGRNEIQDDITVVGFEIKDII